jgi:hypothetical protein
MRCTVGGNRLPLKHLEEEMRTAARRVFLLARDHVARAHRAAIGAAALADADAAQHRVIDFSAVFGKLKMRLRRPLLKICA